jgi:MarR-like DNA-binding transcriptional regulator SgrR of sgrS sRNA
VADFYKIEIAKWNEGTVNLSLEQEAAFLRVVDAIRLSDQPITYNIFALCGLWHCNERKAKRILAELVEAGKLNVEAGKIINE